MKDNKREENKMEHKLVESLSAISTSSTQVTPDILLLDFRIVNVLLVGTADNYILVDTGLNNSADFILKSIKEKFGEKSKPISIILTHAHFDHAGSVVELANLWQVPVYIHPLEKPYVTGEKDYPVGDSSVDKGLVAKLAPTFPHESIDISSHIKELPEDGTFPHMPEWKWIHTPGHTEGHIALYREKDGVLIAADALSTTKQESLWSVMTQKKEVSGPPQYLTTDWKAAENSVRKLASLRPSMIIPAHGKPLEGEEVVEYFEKLVKNFEEIAVPDQGKFVDEEAKEIKDDQ